MADKEILESLSKEQRLALEGTFAIALGPLTAFVKILGLGDGPFSGVEVTEVLEILVKNASKSVLDDLFPEGASHAGQQ